MPHWHGYVFSVHGTELKDAERRPEAPMFRTSDLPPLATRHGLLKALSHVRGTFTSAADAMGWFADEYGRLPPLLRPQSASVFPAPDTAERLADGARVLDSGIDKVWGFWVVGGRYHSIMVICCPNRLELGIPCPAPP